MVDADSTPVITISTPITIESCLTPKALNKYRASPALRGYLDESSL